MALHHASHLPPELCASYAAGEISAAGGLLVACHLTFCASCRSEVRLYEEAAGEMLSAEADAELAPGAWERMVGRLGAPAATSSSSDSVAPPVATLEGLPIPRPLGRWLARQDPTGGPGIALRPMAPGVERLNLHADKISRARLLLFRPGFKLPAHRHSGDEYTLVLAGGVSDRDRHYIRGDVASATATDLHAPQVDADGPCLALIVDQGPIVASSLIHRLFLSLIDA